MQASARRTVPIITQAIIETAKMQATMEISALNSEYIIVEHLGDKYFDIETGKYYYLVKSTYMTPDDAIGVAIAFYEL